MGIRADMPVQRSGPLFDAHSLAVSRSDYWRVQLAQVLGLAANDYRLGRWKGASIVFS